VLEKEVSEDGTVKFLLELEDRRRIESVFIPDTPSQTFCVSTQVGCAMKCGFCLTGKMGLLRNSHRRRNQRPGSRAGPGARLLATKFNIVLMGMGEPSTTTTTP
jgi:23S rRNA (adenine2503-C2)-methyltransferase